MCESASRMRGTALPPRASYLAHSIGARVSLPGDGVRIFLPARITYRKLTLSRRGPARTAGHDYDVCHVACHGHVEPQAILNSWLALTDSTVTIGECATSSCSRHVGSPSCQRAICTTSGRPCRTNPSACPRRCCSSDPEASSLRQVDDLAMTHLMVRVSSGMAKRVAPGRRAEMATRHQQRSGHPLAGPTTSGRLQRASSLAHPWYLAAFAYTGV